MRKLKSKVKQADTILIYTSAVWSLLSTFSVANSAIITKIFSAKKVWKATLVGFLIYTSHMENDSRELKKIDMKTVWQASIRKSHQKIIAE